MNAKQILAVLSLGLPGFAAGAPSEAETGDEQGADERRTQIIIRSDAEKQRRKTLRNDTREFATPAPEPGPGLPPAKADPAGVPGANAQARTDERGWYEYLFGKRQGPGETKDRDWYGYLFGRPDKDDGVEKKDDDKDWWWPFD